VKLPHSVQEALQIDKESGTDFWWRATQKETSKVTVALEYDESMTPEQLRQARTAYVGFQEIRCHMIFDVKMDLTRKLGLRCRRTFDRDAGKYHLTRSVVSRDSVRLAFLIAALNDLEIIACDVGNAYRNAPCREKVWFVAGPEFGSRQGMVVKNSSSLVWVKIKWCIVACNV
jgi:hypothetical protein